MMGTTIAEDMQDNHWITKDETVGGAGPHGCGFMTRAGRNASAPMRRRANYGTTHDH